MKKLTGILHAVLFPGGLITALFVIAGAGSVIYTFASGQTDTFFAYMSFPLSAYALVLVIAAVVRAVIMLKSRARNNKKIVRYFGSREKRARFSLYAVLAFNLLYAVFNGVSGILYRSAWFGAVCVYYIVLSVMRFFLMRGDVRTVKNADRPKAYIAGLRQYLNTGIFMLILSLAMTVMVAQTLYLNKSYTYPGIVIYASAAYTFYIVTAAIVNLFRFRQMENPVLSAAKMISFSTALMSLFTLQAAMLARFGGDEHLRFVQNTITGSMVCLLVSASAIYMIVRAYKMLKNRLKA